MTFNKAITGGIAAAGAALIAALDDGVVTPAEAIGAVVAFVMAFSAVYAVPNRQP
jgi:hypothetical protein